MKLLRIASLIALLSWSQCLAATLDFSTDDGGAPLVNGQHINAPDEFGNLVNISSPTLSVAIFDTDPAGPNAANAVALSTDDLLVGLGNALILQSRTALTQTNPGVFDTPIDSTTGGSIIFDFLSPSQALSIDLIDVDAPDGRSVILSDTAGKTRVYDVPHGWTNDLRDAPNGFATLDLTTLADQTGETAVLATAMEDAGFNPNSLARLEVALTGSGAVDNLVFVPEPTGIVGIGFILAGIISRFRRTV